MLSNFRTSWMWSRVLAGALTIMASPAIAAAQAPPAASDQAELAKKLANPISDLVSVPFQFNWEQPVGPGEETRFVLNVQPVIPFSVTNDWNMIVRIILPFVSQPALFDGGVPAS